MARTVQISFHHRLGPCEGDRWFEECPFPAYATSICYSFPPGCDYLVSVSVGHGSVLRFPAFGELRLDNATPVFNVYDSVEKSERIWCEIKNADDTWSHSIGVILTLQEREEV